MMSWRPTPRRNATGGVVQLFARQEWRDSAHGQEILSAVRAALEDDDAVNRLRAAQVATDLEVDEPSALRLVRRRLLEEPDDHVVAALLNQLGRLAPRLPDDVDVTFGDYVASERARNRLGSETADARDALGSAVSLGLVLAIGFATPAATSLVDSWMRHPTLGPAPLRALYLLRPWLALPPERALERSRGFQFAATAARSLEQQRTSTEAGQLVPVYAAADALINQIYFASGAFGRSGTDNTPTAHQPGFSDEALPVIEILTEFKEPSMIHYLVETLGHLAPADPVRTFVLVEKAVRAGDAYTYDPLAAEGTISLIERYLAEFREVVTTEPALLTALRQVLEAFVRVGWPAAVTLSCLLGEAFR